MSRRSSGTENIEIAIRLLRTLLGFLLSMVVIVVTLGIRQRKRPPELAVQTRWVDEGTRQRKKGLLLLGVVLLTIGGGLVWSAYQADRNAASNAQLRDSATESYEIHYYAARMRRDMATARTHALWSVGAIGLGVCCIIAGLSPEDFQRHLKEQAAALAEAVTQIPVTVYTLHLPRSTEWSSDHTLKFLEQLLVSFPSLLFRIQADASGIVWQLVDYKFDLMPSVLEQTIRGMYPASEVKIASQTTALPAESLTPFYRYICYYQQPNFFVAPILHVHDLKNVDPLVAITEIMSGLEDGERINYTILVEQTALDAYKAGQRLITQSTIHPLQFLSRYGIGNAVYKALSGYHRTEKFQWRDQSVFEDKLRQRLFNTRVMVQVDAPSEYRIMELTALMDTEIANYTRMPFNALQWVERPPDRYLRRIETPEQDRKTDILSTYFRWMLSKTPLNQQAPRLILEPRELAALWHLPHQGFTAERIRWGRGLVGIPESVAKVEQGIVLGRGRYQGREQPIRLALPDRVTHLNIIGRTGTGKSTLMHHLIHQDIARGAGVAVIDPHGSLVRDVLQCSIPEHREGDVVVVDLANRDYPPPLNPLAGTQTYRGTLQVVGVIERLFAGTEHATRVSSYLRAALIPLHLDPQATMRDVTRMFMDDVFREQLLNQIDDPETQDFWDYQYNAASPAMQRQIAEPIINRIRPFYANPYLYPILCHPDTLDFRQLIRERKIILVSLAMDEDLVPEQERNLVGALLISRLQMAGMKDPTPEPFYIYIDEVQKFVTTALPTLFSEARKYGLSLVTANQYLGQLSGKTLEAVMGNVGTSIFFGCSPEDANALAAYTKPHLTAQDLLDLDRFQAVAKLQVNGQTQRAFSVLTSPPLVAGDQATLTEMGIRGFSMLRYPSKTRSEVLTWLRQRYPRQRLTTQEGVFTTSDEDTYYD